MAVGYQSFGDGTGLSMGVGGTESPQVDTTCECDPGTWLLDLTVGGRTFRYSTRRMVVVDGDGVSRFYRGGLADFSMRLDGLQEAQAFQITDHQVNWAELVSRGEALYLAGAVLRHIEPGQVLEEAIVVLDGKVDEPLYGDPTKPAQFVGTLQVDFADILFPDPRATVTSTTWEFTDLAIGGPQFDYDIVGAIYPTVFGFPGDDGSGGNPLGATPALMVSIALGFPQNAAEFLICDGACDAGTVRLFASDQSFGTSGFEGAEDLPVTTMLDALNRPVSIVTVPVSDTAMFPQMGQQYYIGWSEANGGGTKLPDGSGPIRSLTDVAIFALRGSGRAVDKEAQESQRDFLAGFHVDGLLNTEVNLVPWFESTFLPLFPLVRARTTKGMYWRYINWSAGVTDALAHLNVDEGRIRRATGLVTSPDQVRNMFRIDYGYSLRSDTYGLRRVLSAKNEAVTPWYENPDHLTDLRVIGSNVCARSQSDFGVLEATPITSKFVWSAATATNILHHLAARDAFPRRSVSYTGPARELRHLTRGDVVSITDSEAGLASEVAIVMSVLLSSERLAQVDLEVIDRRVRG